MVLIWVCEYGFRRYQVLQGLKGLVLVFRPMPFGILPGQCVQWLGVFGETLDKNAVKIAKAQEGAYVLDFGWHWPVFDAGNFDGVHACNPPSKDYPQVIHFRHM